MQTHIQPPGKFSLSFKELWQYRELFYFFTWRDIKIRYKQTSLGLLWAMLQPLGLMLIFTFLFARTWPIATGNIPYPLFVVAGLLCWNLFNSAVSNAGESILKNAAIINKIYFPRLIIPGSAVLVAFFDFLVGLFLFAALAVYYGYPVQISVVLFIPAATLLTLVAAAGLGTFLAALNIRYRDFRYTVPFGLQLLFFSSQVIYPLASVQPAWVRYVLALNPVNAAVELFRAPLAGNAVDVTVVGIGLGVSLLLFVAGVFYFKKTEAIFADLA
ncbi:MAG: ABC transporter permease [Chitinophagaceae bacterium]|nr:ABC transporter permease [Chitinophagaceae bacterium]